MVMSDMKSFQNYYKVIVVVYSELLSPYLVENFTNFYQPLCHIICGLPHAL